MERPKYERCVCCEETGFNFIPYSVVNDIINKYCSDAVESILTRIGKGFISIDTEAVKTIRIPIFIEGLSLYYDLTPVDILSIKSDKNSRSNQATSSKWSNSAVINEESQRFISNLCNGVKENIKDPCTPMHMVVNSEELTARYIPAYVVWIPTFMCSFFSTYDEAKDFSEYLLGSLHDMSYIFKGKGSEFKYKVETTEGILREYNYIYRTYGGDLNINIDSVSDEGLETDRWLELFKSNLSILPTVANEEMLNKFVSYDWYGPLNILTDYIDDGGINVE